MSPAPLEVVENCEKRPFFFIESACRGLGSCRRHHPLALDQWHHFGLPDRGNEARGSVVRAEAGVAVAAELPVANAIGTDDESPRGEGLERRQETPLLLERQEEDDLGSGDASCMARTPLPRLCLKS